MLRHRACQWALTVALPQLRRSLVAPSLWLRTVGPGCSRPGVWRQFLPLVRCHDDPPDVVSGTGRNDLALMRAGAGRLVSKVGADGVQVVASRSRAQAFAIKIIDASKPALYAATVETFSN